MSDEALPCPWCNPNNAGLAPRVNTANGTLHWVFCPECGVHGPCGIGEDGAITRWNFIVRPSVSTAELEKLIEREGETHQDEDGLADGECVAIYLLRDLISKATNGRGK